jgi:hypothetical protein
LGGDKTLNAIHETDPEQLNKAFTQARINYYESVIPGTKMANDLPALIKRANYYLDGAVGVKMPGTDVPLWPFAVAALAAIIWYRNNKQSVKIIPPQKFVYLSNYK